MDPLNLRQICALTAGQRVGGSDDLLVRRIVTDTRGLRPGDLFVCLAGDRFDGHSFAAEAIAHGAVAALVNRDVGNLAPVVRVSDTLAALGLLGNAVRRAARVSASPSVVGITGTNGKTGTKELTAAALGASLMTVRSPRSYNNSIGVPLTLLDIDATTQAAVVEIGTSARGEIARLTRLVEPDIGVITNIGPGHLAGLGTVEGVCEEKGSLLEGLVGRRVSVLNRDDACFAALAARAPGEVVSFGRHRDADVRAKEVRCRATGTRFKLDDGTSVRLRHLGRHAALNALAALAVARVLDVPLDAAVDALAEVPPPPGRLALRQVGALTLVDDTYNANPGSLAAAAATLADIGLDGRKVVVVGDMLELGDGADALHRHAGARLADSGVELLFAVGRHASALVEGAVEAGLDGARCILCKDRRSVEDALAQRLLPGDVVLVKASRAMGLESILAGLGGAAQLASS
ncbi:MAG: UDP-N-acetylmuramoyl-tripeptide--D-alanyl-D-alanine ligase [Planctomycetes bacterium]|nr:UDP-N-acetylmuramoyl-tripeptide--D-alanyl-D-alanine ligase [Planctomycetota bacterium]